LLSLPFFEKLSTGLILGASYFERHSLSTIGLLLNALAVDAKTNNQKDGITCRARMLRAGMPFTSGGIMRKIFVTTAALLCFQAFTSAHATDVNVGVSIAGEVSPGVYGRVDIGNTRPQIVYSAPVVIMKQPRPVAPVYMHVPPGHAKNWSKHCHKYNACSQPVYFVKSAEYDSGPRGKKRDRDDDHGDHHGRGHGRGHGRDH
jgi:hypothetical protein